MAAKASRPRIPKPTIERAVGALLKWLHSDPKPKPSSDFIFVVLTLKSIPHAGQSFSLQIPLPHPFPHPTVLLIDDRQNPKSTPQSLSLPVTDIVPFSEADRFQFPSSGLLLLDRRCEKRFKKKKMNAKLKKGVRVVAVDLSKEPWQEEVRRECGLAMMKFGGGNGSTVRVGRGNMQSRTELVENVAVAVEKAVGQVPRRWRNVRAVHLKAAESVALPLYEAVEEDDEVGVEEKKEQATSIRKQNKAEEIRKDKFARIQV